MSRAKFDLTTEADKHEAGNSTSPSFLKSYQVEMIDEALRSLGDYGEVRLIVEKGRLRFLVMQRSYDVLKLDPQVLKG